jgi:hypothetical protein
MAIVIKEIHVKTTIERTESRQEWFMEEIQKLKRSMVSEINDLKRRQATIRKRR